MNSVPTMRFSILPSGAGDGNLTEDDGQKLAQTRTCGAGVT
jgi:hypothetical protein